MEDEQRFFQTLNDNSYSAEPRLGRSTVGALISVVGLILTIDTLLIAGVPLLLVLAKRPALGLASSILTGALIIIDAEINFDGISYPKGLGILGLPAETLPLSIFIILVTMLLCVWAISRDI